ncbi:hypothetical protein VP01_3403g1 [Puccinia sorghi]|uniref:Secreted protein n=1 Tax=Puccinia sorghi TaxID=27349 RepID=A0A0L6UWN2_9BASI|nr:hypothetical protein VP01_3403g1 [Puccinia sorghi]
MFFQAFSRLLLAVGIALCVSSAAVADTSIPPATTVCGAWWRKLKPDDRKMTVKIYDNKAQPVGKIPGSSHYVRNLPQGTGACGITYGGKGSFGACLWDGGNINTTTSSNLSPGWLNGAHTANCGKKFYANKKNVHMEGTVVDACSFNDDAPKIGIAEGCSTMYVTQDLYDKLTNTKHGDVSKIKLVLDNWDFVNAPSA